VDGSVAFADFVTHGGGNLTGLDASKLRLYRGTPLVLDPDVTVAQESGVELSFTPTTPFADAEPVAISGDVGAVTDANGDPLEAFTNFAVTNATDTTPPTVAGVINTAKLRLTASEDLDPTSTFTGFTKHGTTATLASTGTLVGTRIIDFAVTSGTVAPTDVVTLDFDGAAGHVKDVAGNNMAAFTGMAITNRAAGGSGSSGAIFSGVGVAVGI
jgi:hypothetical protein